MPIETPVGPPIPSFDAVCCYLMVIIAMCHVCMSRSALGPCTSAPDVVVPGCFSPGRETANVIHIWRRSHRGSGRWSLVRPVSGNNAGVSMPPPSESADHLWAEAAAAVQADVDSDVHAEARGIMVAEMADVTVAERLAALSVGSFVEIETTAHTVIAGRLAGSGADHLVIHEASRVCVVPMHAIAAVASLPRVVHDADALRVRPLWRRSVRAHLGAVVHVDVGVRRFTGVLVWVGNDHLDVRTDHGTRTVAWSVVTLIGCG